jgi:hypothetical protein
LGTVEGLLKTTKWVMQRGIFGTVEGGLGCVLRLFSLILTSARLILAFFWGIGGYKNHYRRCTEGRILLFPVGFSFSKYVTSRSSVWAT